MFIEKNLNKSHDKCPYNNRRLKKLCDNTETLPRRFTDEGSVPEMRIWSIVLIKSDLKWCIHHSRSLFLYSDPLHHPCDEIDTNLENVHKLPHRDRGQHLIIAERS